MRKLIFALLVPALFFFIACEKQGNGSGDDNGNGQSSKKEGVITGAASSISEVSVIITSEAYPTPEMGEVELGVVLSSEQSFPKDNITEKKSNSLDSKNTFTVEFNYLTSGKKYFYKAFIKYGGLYYYGDVKSFETLTPTVNIITLPADGIEGRKATVHGKVSVSSSIPLNQAVYFVLGKTSDDVKRIDSSNCVHVNISGDGSFSYEYSVLEHETTYYYNTVIEVGAHFFWGEPMSFTTLAATGGEYDELEFVRPDDWYIDFSRYYYPNDKEVKTRQGLFEMTVHSPARLFVKFLPENTFEIKYGNDYKKCIVEEFVSFMADVEANNLNWKDLLLNVMPQVKEYRLDFVFHGNYDFFLAEVNSEGKLTGKYRTFAFTIPDDQISYGYDKYLGTYYDYINGKEVKFQITQAEANCLYYVDGWETGPSVSTQMDRSSDWLYARYDRFEDKLYFFAQYVSSDTDGAWGDVDECFTAAYEVQNSLYYDLNAVDKGADIAHISYSDGKPVIESEEANIEGVGMTTYRQMEYVMYSYEQAQLKRYNPNWNYFFPMRLTSYSHETSVNTQNRKHREIPFK